MGEELVLHEFVPDARLGASSEYLQGQGVFVAVVGPSGAGKDTVMSLARDILKGTITGAETQFVRRIITRPADAAAEDHDTLSEAEFAAAKEGGDFAVTWTAHGLSYGLPKSVDAAIKAGNVVVANGSRGAIADIAARYENTMFVHVTAPREVLADRLAARGRETKADILARLERAGDAPQIPGAVMIENVGEPGAAAGQMVEIIKKAAARAALSGLI